MSGPAPLMGEDLAEQVRRLARWVMRKYRNHPEYEDLLSGCWLEAWEKITALVAKTGHGPDHVPAYAVRAMRWWLADYFKKMARNEMPYAVPEEEGPPLWERPTDPEAEWRWKERLQQVEAAIRMLPEWERAALHALVLSPTPFRAWARESDLPLGTVKVRAARARARLREWLEEEA